MLLVLRKFYFILNFKLYTWAWKSANFICCWQLRSEPHSLSAREPPRIPLKSVRRSPDLLSGFGGAHPTPISYALDILGVSFSARKILQPPQSSLWLWHRSGDNDMNRRGSCTDDDFRFLFNRLIFRGYYSRLGQLSYKGLQRRTFEDCWCNVM